MGAGLDGTMFVDNSVLFHCFNDVFFLSPALCYIFHSPMGQCSLFVLNVPFNTNKRNRQSLTLFNYYVVSVGRLFSHAGASYNEMFVSQSVGPQSQSKSQFNRRLTKRNT